MANDYLTLAEFKAALPDFDWTGTTVYDTLITTLISAASRGLDQCVGKWPGYFYASADSVRYFDAPTVGGPGLIVDDLAAAPTEVAVSLSGGVSAGSYTALAATDYLLLPFNALGEERPYWELYLDTLNGSYSNWGGFRRGVRITGKWGYAITTPADVKQVATEQAIRWFKLSQNNYQDKGNEGDVPIQQIYSGGERYRNIDADFARLVAHYRGVVI